MGIIDRKDPPDSFGSLSEHLFGVYNQFMARFISIDKSVILNDVTN